ncbi:MAG: FAD-dependent oxidoreductase [Solirubrobacteraceae bacterium]|nr:FAD-dependent oxidoreductase [Solirubrobacteraceae bacterium]
MHEIRHSAHGYWLEEAPAPEPLPRLTEDLAAEVVIIGGGYTGMWTAWHLLDRLAPSSIVLLEASICGHGPSGRNGGFCETLWLNLPSLRERLGDERALRLVLRSVESVEAIGAFCEEHGVDAWYRRRGTITASAAPAQDDAGRDAVAAAAALGVPERVVALSPEEVRRRCASPVFRGGVYVPDEATVQPARLALGLRRVLAERGVRIFEHTRARRLAPAAGGGVAVTTADGRTVRAGRAVLAINAAARGFRPLRGRLAVTSSHVLITEPVPDVLEQLGWTGGENITDGRTFVHYFRTTPDKRIAFGWGGGRIAWGARLGGRTEVDPDVVRATHRHLLRVFPQLEGRRIEHAWGGPIDVSPSHLPQVGTLPEAPVHYAFGFTGNGVGPSHLAARTLAALATGETAGDELTALHGDRDAKVPPEPLAWAGGSLVRLANLRKEELEEQGRVPSPGLRAIAGAPRMLGIHLGR